MAGPVFSTEAAGGFAAGPPGGSARFGATLCPIGQALGLTGLGLMLTEVPPGKRAYPFHNHLGNDEAFVILAGEGTFRFGGSEYPVKAGDVCGAPRGGPDTAHQLVNTGSVPLRYVSISTRNDPDVVEYPDSGKYAAIAVAPGPDFRNAHLRALGRAGESLGYWDGEEV